MKTLKSSWWVLAWIIVLVITMFITKEHVKIPEVHKSVSTGELVLYCPEQPDGIKITKDELPDTYRTVWTK